MRLAPAKKTGDGKIDAENSAREQALGRSRGGFTTKLHLICDAKGTPLAFSLTPGNIHDVTAFDELFATCMGQLRAYGWNQHVKLVACDKGYDSDRVRELCRANGLEPVIPRRRGPQGQDRSDPRFDKKTYRKRNHVERCIGWLKENRRMSTRYEKLARSYAGMVELAIIRRLLRTA